MKLIGLPEVPYIDLNLDWNCIPKFYENFAYNRFELLQLNEQTKYMIKQPIVDQCLPTSVFNAYPYLFNHDKDMLLDYIKRNNYKITVNKLLSDFKTLNKQNFNIVTKKTPFVAIFAIGSLTTKAHAITVLTIDSKNIYYFENGLNQVLLINIINQLATVCQEEFDFNPKAKEFFYNAKLNSVYKYLKTKPNVLSNNYTKFWVNLVNSKVKQFKNLTIIDKTFLTNISLGSLEIYDKEYKQHNLDNVLNMSYVKQSFDEFDNCTLKNYYKRLKNITLG